MLQTFPAHQVVSELLLTDKLHVEVPSGASSKQVVEAVLLAAFDWYYIPRSDERKSWANAVVAETMTKIDLAHAHTLPNWFWRVRERLVFDADFSTEDSVVPPCDPRKKPSGRSV